MKTNTLILSSLSILLLSGCALTNKQQNTSKTIDNHKVRTVINYNNSVKAKVVPPTALKATIYPIKDENSGSFTDKQEVYYWVSKAKFKGAKKRKEVELDSRIKKFLEE